MAIGTFYRTKGKVVERGGSERMKGRGRGRRCIEKRERKYERRVGGRKG